MRTFAEIRSIVTANRQANRRDYDGLTSAEIGRYNQSVMFGEDDEAFPSDGEWSRIVN